MSRSLLRRALLAPIAAALLSGCLDPTPPLTELLGGPAGRAAVATPVKVEAVRLGPSASAVSPTGGEEPPGDAERTPQSQWRPRSLPEGFADYREVAGPAPVPAAEAAALSAALTADGWLTPNEAKACGVPRYGVKFLFTGENGATTEVWNCFECDVLAVVVGGEAVGGDDSDALRPVLLAAARAAFPDDPELTSLD